VCLTLVSGDWWSFEHRASILKYQRLRDHRPVTDLAKRA
jgi:hypothetical protein